MVYLDATVFYYVAAHNGPKASAAAATLDKVAAGRMKASTSVLTASELASRLARQLGPAQARQAAQAVLGFPNLRLIPFTVEIGRDATRLMEKYERLEFSDAVHVASGLAAGATQIITDDDDYDGVKELRRAALA